MERRYGYQPELDFDYGDDRTSALRNRLRRITQFLRNPEDVRALMGDIYQNREGNYVTGEIARGNARQVLREISRNPKLLSDAQYLAENRSLLQNVGDVYALRSLLGEQPAAYGAEGAGYTSDRRGQGVDTEGYSRIIEGPRQGERTIEMSPIARGEATSPALRPMNMSRDLDVIRDVATVEGLDIFGDQDIADNMRRTLQVIADNYQEASEDFGQPVTDYAENREYFPDFENTREAIDVDPDGSVTIFGRDPQDVSRFVQRVESLSEDLDRDRLFDFLASRDGQDIDYLDEDDIRSRFDDAYNAQTDLDFDDYEPDYETPYRYREQSRETLDDLNANTKAPIGDGYYAGEIQKGSEGKIGASDFLTNYGRYIPVKGTETKVDHRFLQENMADIGDALKKTPRVQRCRRSFVAGTLRIDE